MNWKTLKDVEDIEAWEVGLHWYGVSERDCAFFQCQSKTLQQPVPARLRAQSAFRSESQWNFNELKRMSWGYKSYASEADVSEVEDAYRGLWNAEIRGGLRPDLLLCLGLTSRIARLKPRAFRGMELRDAYFLWKASNIATIYYPAIIFMQDEVHSLCIRFAFALFDSENLWGNECVCSKCPERSVWGRLKDLN